MCQTNELKKVNVRTGKKRDLSQLGRNEVRHNQAVTNRNIYHVVMSHCVQDTWQHGYRLKFTTDTKVENTYYTNLIFK